MFLSVCRNISVFICLSLSFLISLFISLFLYAFLFIFSFLSFSLICLFFSLPLSAYRAPNLFCHGQFSFQHIPSRFLTSVIDISSPINSQIFDVSIRLSEYFRLHLFVTFLSYFPFYITFYCMPFFLSFHFYLSLLFVSFFLSLFLHIALYLYFSPLHLCSSPFCVCFFITISSPSQFCCPCPPCIWLHLFLCLPFRLFSFC